MSPTAWATSFATAWLPRRPYCHGNYRTRDQSSCLILKEWQRKAQFSSAEIETTNVVDDRFLRHVENTVERVLTMYPTSTSFRDVPLSDREALKIANNLHKRLTSTRSNTMCRRCWLQNQYCVCPQCPPLPLPSYIRRIFLLMHHKEVCLAVDTSKAILTAFPDQSRLVVGGISEKFQPTMAELMEACQRRTTLVLYPDQAATTIDEIQSDRKESCHLESDDVLDIVVLDGTWEQTRRLYNRYILGLTTTPVQLSPTALVTHNKAQPVPSTPSTSLAGHQLRWHVTPTRQIATAHALYLLLEDMEHEAGASPGLGAAFRQHKNVLNAAIAHQLRPRLGM